MISIRAEYADDWDAFMARIRKYSRNQHAALLAEATVDEKLAMVHRLARDWLARDDNAQIRLQRSQAKMTEERRMTAIGSAFRPYVDPDTKAMLPPIAVGRRPAADRYRDAGAAARFWQGMEAGAWRAKTVTQIVKREGAGVGPLWILTHPYGPRTTRAELDALASLHRSTRPAVGRPTLGYAPAGMTPERALQIAIAVLEGRGA